jgi:hypothetical protein
MRGHVNGRPFTIRLKTKFLSSTRVRAKVPKFLPITSHLRLAPGRLRGGQRRLAGNRALRLLNACRTELMSRTAPHFPRWVLSVLTTSPACPRAGEGEHSSCIETPGRAGSSEPPLRVSRPAAATTMRYRR